MTRRRLAPRSRLPVALGVLLAATLSACGGSGSKPAAAPSPQLSPAAEPQVAPPAARPGGTVVAVGDTPEGVVVDQVHGLAIAALRHPDALAVTPLQAPHPIRVIALPGRARHLSLVADGGPLLLPAEDTDTLLEVSLPAGRVAATHTTLKQPHDAVFAGDRLWVTDELAGRVSVIADGVGGETVAVLPAGAQPGGLAAAGGRVAAADVRGNQLYVYDTASLRVVGILPAGSGPTHVIQTGPDTIAVADTRGGAVLLYDLSGTPRLLQRVPLPGGPYGLAVDAERHRLWVALSGRNQVVRLDIGTTALTLTNESYATVRQPNSLAVDTRTGALVIAGATTSGELQFLPVATATS